MNPEPRHMLQRKPFFRSGLPFLLVGVFLIMYILPLGVRPLAVPDEVRYAEIPREMIANDDWVVPRLNGVRYFEKPVLGYWLNAGSLLLFGENNFAVRLPSALAVGLSALLIFVVVFQATRRAVNEESWTAALAALVFLTSAAVLGIGTFAVLDSLFAFFLTATVVTFYLATEARRSSAKEKALLFLAGIFCGLAFLTKGFLAFAVPGLTLAPYLLWQRRFTDIVRMSLMPFFSVLITILPWSILIHLQEPDYWPYFFWHEHINRFFASDAQHKASFWLFFIAVPAMAMPWSLMVPAAVAGLGRSLSEPGPRGRLVWMCLFWLVLPFLLFSASKGKLLTYILPCFPPFAVLLAMGMTRLAETGRSTGLRGGIMALAAVAGLAIPALLYLQFFGYQGFHPYEQLWKTALAVAGAMAVLVVSVSAWRIADLRKRILLFGLTPVALFFCGNYLVPDVIVQVKKPGVLLERNAVDIGPDELLLADTGTVRAVCWYFKRDDVYLLGGAGELTYGMGYPDAWGRQLDIRAANALIEANRGNVVFVTQLKKLHKLSPHLPEPFFQDNSGPRGFVLLRY